MNRLVAPLIAALLAAAAMAGLALADRNGGDDDRDGSPSYALAVWGDMPYSDVQTTSGVPNLIADMNRQRLAFSVHDGASRRAAAAATTLSTSSSRPS
jgi:hypothetical protein